MHLCYIQLILIDWVYTNMLGSFNYRPVLEVSRTTFLNDIEERVLFEALIGNYICYCVIICQLNTPPNNRHELRSSCFYLLVRQTLV